MVKDKGKRDGQGRVPRIGESQLAHSKRWDHSQRKHFCETPGGVLLFSMGLWTLQACWKGSSRYRQKAAFIYSSMLSCKCLLQCVPIHCLSLKSTSCRTSSQFAAKEKMKPANSCFWVQSLYLRGQVGLQVTIWTEKEQQIPATNLLLCTGSLWLRW